MKVSVIYASEQAQVEIPLSLSPGCLVRHAIEASGLLKRFPEINLAINKVGIYNRRVSLEKRLKENDRVEIYRPLKIDPKEARRKRAKENKC